MTEDLPASAVVSQPELTETADNDASAAVSQTELKETADNGASEAVSPPELTEYADNGDGQKQPITEEKKKIRKPARYNIFKAAFIFMTRKSSNNHKKKPIQSSEKEDVPSKGENWKKLVGSMRPLHIPNNKTPTLSPSSTVDNFEDLLPQPSSSTCPSPSVHGGSSTGTMSQYASASNLQELDDNNSDHGKDNSDHGNDDPDEVFDAIRGDEMIDAKAEEFIAKFYQQMRLQNF